MRAINFTPIRADLNKFGNFFTGLKTSITGFCDVNLGRLLMSAGCLRLCGLG